MALPIAGNRAWVGFAKEGGQPTFLTAAVIATATSIPVSGTVVPASSTIYFVDGIRSEQATVTGGGGTSSLTVAAITYAHSANTPIFWQLTANIGPAYWMPVDTFDAQDAIAFVDDKGLRGSNVSVYNSLPVAAHSEIGIDGDVFPDVFGFVIGSVYGAVDFSGGSPNTHTFASMNTAASNGQPTPLLLFLYDGYNIRIYAGAKCSEVQLKFDPMQNLKYTSKWTAFQSGVIGDSGSWAGTGSPTFSALTPQGAWQAATSINSVLLGTVLTADFTVKRDSMDAIQTLDGNQQPLVVWSGPLSTSGNINVVMEDDTQITIFETAAPVPISFTLVNGTGATQVEVNLQMTNAYLTNGWKPTVPGSKGYVEVGGPVSGDGNTTDANTAGGGYSPSRMVLKNSMATGSYQ